MVIGTDYPYDMGYYKPVDFVNGAKLTRAQKDAIIGGNGAKLRGLKSKALKRTKPPFAAQPARAAGHKAEAFRARRLRLAHLGPLLMRTRMPGQAPSTIRKSRSAPSPSAFSAA